MGERNKRTKLKKSMGPGSIWAVAVGSIIGWGCFIQGGLWTERAGGPLPLFLGFLAGGWNGYKVAMTTLKMNEQEEKKEDQEARREQKGEPRPPVHKPKQKSRVRRHEDDEKL